MYTHNKKNHLLEILIFKHFLKIFYRNHAKNVSLVSVSVSRPLLSYPEYVERILCQIENTLTRRLQGERTCKRGSEYILFEILDLWSLL